MSKRYRFGRSATIALLAMGMILSVGVGRASADHDVEHRIAQFWQRVDALGPGDYLSARDVGQWALNVIERDARTRITVADFRASAAGLQAAFDRAGPAPVAAPAPTPTPAPAPGAFTFGTGAKVVGTGVSAGTYRTRTAASGCYWKRLSGFGGTSGEIIANGISDDPTVVTIAPTDRGFDSSSCATWTSDLSAITTSLTGPFAGGMFIVGTDIAAGTWTAPGGGSSFCYWARLSGFSGESKDLIANGVPSGTAIVTIATTDRGFKSSGCGTWTKTG